MHRIVTEFDFGAKIPIERGQNRKRQIIEELRDTLGVGRLLPAQGRLELRRPIDRGVCTLCGIEANALDWSTD